MIEHDIDIETSTLVDFGMLRGLDPIDTAFGGGRGKPIDRHYIERFLERHGADVHGRVLEVASDDYTWRYGAGRVARADVLHINKDNPHATLVADLAQANGLPTAAFECFICTQTLQYVFDLAAAIRNIHKLLKPGGVLLLTVPGISQISPYDSERWGEHWRFTPQSVMRLLGDAFDAINVTVEGHGNVLAAISFLQGLACEDLRVDELDHVDDRYPMLITARACKIDVNRVD